jgi:hypothetical protein
MMADDVTYEWVDGPDSAGPRPATREEWGFICDTFVERSWMMPNRSLTRILLAKRGEEIVGFHVMQLVPHAEPMWVDKAERGTGLAADMADQMVKFLKDSDARGWLVLAGDPVTEKLCRERGMEKIASAVYRTQ